MSQPARFRTGTADHARRVEKLFTLPSRISGSAPSRLLDTVGWISILWVAAALLGFGVFSGGTTSLVLALVLLYGTGACLTLLGWLAWRGARRRAIHRFAAAPAVRDLLAATESAREEFIQALFPAGATGIPEVLRATAPARAAADAAPRSALPGPAAGGTSGAARQTAPRSGKSPIRKKARCKSAARRNGTPPPVQEDFARAA